VPIEVVGIAKSDAIRRPAPWREKKFGGSSIGGDDKQGGGGRPERRGRLTWGHAAQESFMCAARPQKKESSAQGVFAQTMESQAARTKWKRNDGGSKASTRQEIKRTACEHLTGKAKGSGPARTGSKYPTTEELRA